MILFHHFFIELHFNTIPFLRLTSTVKYLKTVICIDDTAYRKLNCDESDKELVFRTLLNKLGYFYNK